MIINKENPVLKTALRKFMENTGMKAEIERVFTPPDYNGIDGQIKIIAKGKTLIVQYIMKGKFVFPERLLLKEAHADYFAERVIVTNYINAKMAKILKDRNIQFIDAAGNAYLQTGGLFIFIAGNKPELKQAGGEGLDRVFHTGGMKVLFALLCNEGIINYPYRDIAEKAKVANGTVGWVLNDLLKEGYLIKKKTGRELIRKNELFDDWVRFYKTRFKNKLNTIRYKRADGQPLNITGDVYREYALLLGGETAAALITGYLTPILTILYGKGNALPFILKNKLIADKSGDIEITEKFWDFNDINENDGFVPDMLIYADLIATEDQRNLETAEIIYEQRIKRRFE